jgi:hypothetical protein
MSGPEAFGKILLVSGGVLVLLGTLFVLSGRIPHIGRLPGDIFLHKGNFSLFLPIATSLLLSIVLTIILNLVFRFFR